MNEQTLIIKLEDGFYHIENSDFNDFELLGLLEQVIFDLKFSKVSLEQTPAKTAPQAAPSTREPIEPTTAAAAAVIAGDMTDIEPARVDPKPIADPVPAVETTNPAAAELRTRIGKAVKAVRELGGKIEITDLAQMTEDELQSELEALTNQYKRLKSSQKG